MPKINKPLLYLLFALSGFSALVYEILWTRYLSLTFGTTIVAASLVAATFMAGLAIGSYLLGRYADQQSNLLRVYAFLEIGIAFTAFLLPPTLQIVETIYIGILHAFPDYQGMAHLLHFAFAVILLLPPTICMGGTFPLMCRFFARKKSGGQIGRLYALNTLGATAGAFLGAYLLIPSLGISATNYLAIAINLGIAAVSFVLSLKIGHADPLDVSKAHRPDQPLLWIKNRSVLFAIGCIGFFSLAYEILWTRLFLLFLGNTTYAFSLILSAFLIGLAVGGAQYARIVKPELKEKELFVTLTTLMALVVLFTVPFYDQLAHLFLTAHQIADESWWLLSFLSYLIVFVVIAAPAVLSGALLPAAVAIIDPGKVRTGEGVGLVVLANTVGAVLGALLAGFLLIPLLGVQNSFRLLAVGNLILGFYLFLRFRTTGVLRFLCPAFLACGLLVAIFPMTWRPELMNSGVYIYAQKYLQMGGLEKILAQERILKVIEGRETTVAIHESLDGQNRFFTVNGKTDGGTGIDMATQILVGHLPLLLHPSPDDVLVIGLGTGISLHGLADHPVNKIDCVEISPEVVKAYDYFKSVTADPLQNPKVELLINDGRNHLLTTTSHYDVIVSEPSNPWQSGNANLFTDDFYKIAAGRLKPNGLFCQWIGLYDITPENLRTLARTFLRTFPRAMVFIAGSDLVIVGAQHELTFDYNALSRRMQVHGVKRALADIGIHTPGELIATHYLYSEEPFIKMAGNAQINSDDQPILEYSARYNLGAKTLGEFQAANMQLMHKHKDKVFLPVVNLGATPLQVAQTLRDLSHGYAKIGKQDAAQNFLQKAESLEN